MGDASPADQPPARPPLSERERQALDLESAARQRERSAAAWRRRQRWTVARTLAAGAALPGLYLLLISSGNWRPGACGLLAGLVASALVCRLRPAIPLAALAWSAAFGVVLSALIRLPGAGGGSAWLFAFAPVSACLMAVSALLVAWTAQGLDDD